jgi:galactose mutarotase-like enzyme
MATRQQCVLGNADGKGQSLAPFANRIHRGRYDFSGTSYQLPINDHNTTYPNGHTQVLNDAVDGLLFDKKLDLRGITSNYTPACVHLGYTFNDAVPGFPFDLEIQLAYCLSSSTGFQLNTTAINKMSTASLPFYHAWHPYFNVSDTASAELILDPCTEWNQLLLNSHRKECLLRSDPDRRSSSMEQIRSGESHRWH